nr:hypothetical protein [Nannocystis sp.]
MQRGQALRGHAQGPVGVDERLGQLVHALEAVVRVLAQGDEDHVLDLGRDRGLGAAHARRDGLIDHLHGDGGHEGVALEGHVAGQHLVHEDAERVDVDAGIGFLIAGDLRGHVLGRAEQGAGLGGHLRLVVAAAELAVGDDLGDAEVEDLDEVVVAAALDAKAVVRLHVAVHDALLVRGVKRPADLKDHAPQAGPRLSALALQQGREVLAFEVLHRQEGEALLRVAEVGDVDDVLVVQHRRGAGLLEEAGDDLGAVAVLGGEHLHGELAADRDVLGLVDRAHAALADQLEQAIAIGEDVADEVGVRAHLAGTQGLVGGARISGRCGRSVVLRRTARRRGAR